MIDFSSFGKEGLIIQYEDTISMVGFNIVNYMRDKKATDKIARMSVNEILVSYLNRETENVETWLKEEYGIDCNLKDYLDSFVMFRPNLLYSYKVFDAAYRNGIRKLGIHSRYKSKVIEQALHTYGQQIDYTYGDIVPVLNEKPNMTYLTSSPSQLKECLNVKAPCVITIVDDYLYTADVLSQKLDEELRKRDKYICFTSVISAGII